MSYHIEISSKADQDIAFHKKAGNKAVLNKMLVLFNELTEHPYTGTGKPEPLKYALSGLWSRRINGEHRLVYEVYEEGQIVLVLSAKGHYN